MEDQGQDEDLDLSRGKRILITLSGAMLVLLFFGTIASFLFEPRAMFYLGSRGSLYRMPLTRLQGLAIFIPLLALFIAIAASGFWRSLRETWRKAEAGAEAPELPLGETTLWSGRPGWRSFRGPRVVGLFLAVLLPGLLFWWLGTIAFGPRGFSEKLFWSLFPSFFLFGTVLPGLISGSSYIHAWICDVFGSIAITRERIAWLTPGNRHIYRQIARAEIVDAFLSDAQGKRGSITVVQRLGADDVEHVYIDGLPEPESAIAALQR